MKVLTERFTNGGDITSYELQQTYKRIIGRPYPPGAKPSKIAQSLSTQYALRFEFEVNRLRGFAWDSDDAAVDIS